MHILEWAREPDAGITGPSEFPHNLKLALPQLLYQGNRVVPKALLRRKHVWLFVTNKFFAILFVVDPHTGRRLIERSFNIGSQRGRHESKVRSTKLRQR